MESSTASAQMCKATTKAGDPCSAYAQKDSDYCYMHDPSKAVERHKAQVKGGKARQGRKLIELPPADGRVEINQAGDVLPVLERELNALLSGVEVSVSRARAVAYLCKGVIEAYKVTELEERMEAVERVLESRATGSQGRRW